MAKVTFGAMEVSAETVLVVAQIGEGMGRTNQAWVELGRLANARPDGVSLASFGQAVMERCKAEGVDAPGLTPGFVSKGAKVAACLIPLGVMAREDVLRQTQRVLYAMARAVEDGVVGESAALDDVLAWVLDGGKLDRKRRDKRQGEGEADGGGEDGDKDQGELDSEEVEVLRLMREGAAAANLTLLEFARKAAAAALAA